MNEMKGFFVYKDTLVFQHGEIQQPFKTLFERIQPRQILEIGTASGGLTLFIRDILDEISLHDTVVKSYDIVKNHYLENTGKLEVITKNIFTYPYDALEEEDEVSDFIKMSGPTIVLCDGGSKKNEFNILSPLLKNGDIIMAHDYAPNQTFFEEYIKDKVWNWMEIQDSDISNICEKENLQNYMYDEFVKVVWVCKQKVNNE